MSNLTQGLSTIGIYVLVQLGNDLVLSIGTSAAIGLESKRHRLPDVSGHIYMPTNDVRTVAVTNVEAAHHLRAVSHPLWPLAAPRFVSLQRQSSR